MRRAGSDESFATAARALRQSVASRSRVIKATSLATASGLKGLSFACNSSLWAIMKRSGAVALVQRASNSNSLLTVGRTDR